jgi:predicted  nucleic acid-binding Zn-ribbon protein
MDSQEHEERIRRMEKRYESARNALAIARSEFEMLSRAPIHAPARLAQLAQEVDRLTRERARIGEQLARLEDMVV